MPKQLKQDFYFIYSEVEGGNFQGWRFLDSTIKEAREYLKIIKKTKVLRDSSSSHPVHSIIMTKPVTDWERIK